MKDLLSYCLNIKVQSQKRQIKNINIKKTWTKEGIILGYLQHRGRKDKEYKFFAVILFLDFVLLYKTLKLIISCFVHVQKAAGGKTKNGLLLLSMRTEEQEFSIVSSEKIRIDQYLVCRRQLVVKYSLGNVSPETLGHQASSLS